MGLVDSFDKIAARMKRQAQTEFESAMKLPPDDLDYWLVRVRSSASQAEVFDLLDKFRPLPWSDEQRALISRAYINRLEALQRERTKQAVVSESSIFGML